MTDVGIIVALALILLVAVWVSRLQARIRWLEDEAAAARETVYEIACAVADQPCVIKRKAEAQETEDDRKRIAKRIGRGAGSGC